ncbi:MAG: hypothetical protein WA071_14535 [Undibacterium umbellatum]|uniref:hypothetical protein n=1 Tax=Undibacterium umbellatum TaxID=2762300 RepID=UPI003BB55A17
MTTKNDMAKEYDLFEIWLMDMSDALENFLNSLPKDVSEKLDFSPDSLNILENYILTKYSGSSEILAADASKMVDGMARYVGQTFRRSFNGKWIIDYNDKKNAFYGLPQIANMQGQVTQFCPATLVTASVHRKTGIFIKTVYNNYLERTIQARGAISGA